ncbi:MAG: rhomboid family intramembrane serine protease [Verrucomicrobia bacterium]|nr:rhomboid family intramembrane serine protease [Verrucomicrobiota bacterium]
MRLIGNVKNEKQAFLFYSFLLGEGIHCTYEIDKAEQKNVVLIWVYEEDQIERAEAYLEEFKNNPNDPKFTKVEFPEAPPVPPDHIGEPKKPQEPDKRSWKDHPRKIKKHPLTSLIIFVCVFLYMLTLVQQGQLVQTGGQLAMELGMTPIQQQMMFDYPSSNQKIDELLQQYSLKDYKSLDQAPPSEKKAFIDAQNIPTWQGVMTGLLYKFKGIPAPTSIDGPMFGKIREGEVWRLFTPVLLHGSLLHILFNMIWVWILLPPIEARLPKWKILLLILLLGVIPCVAQYLVSGPYFLGFSGIVVGLVGFIWVRQRVAPWEGYPLQKTTIIFVLVYVAALFGLEIFALIKNVITTSTASANIANTAHIVGGLIGMLLGALPFFSRGAK